MLTGTIDGFMGAMGGLPALVFSHLRRPITTSSSFPGKPLEDLVGLRGHHVAGRPREERFGQGSHPVLRSRPIFSNGRGPPASRPEVKANAGDGANQGAQDHHLGCRGEWFRNQPSFRTAFSPQILEARSYSNLPFV